MEPEPERPRSIILIRLRQRPSFDGQTLQMPSPEQFFNKDPIQFFNDIIRQFKEKAGQFDQSIRQSIDENSKDIPKAADFPDISDLIKTIPIIRLPGNLRADSSSESSEETHDRRPLIDQFKQAIEQSRERAEPVNSRVRQFFTNIRGQWNDLVVRQPKVPVWIFLAILLSSSAILWCKFRQEECFRVEHLVIFRYGYVTLSSHTFTRCFINSCSRTYLSSL